MLNNEKHQAILITTDKLTGHTLKFYYSLQKAAAQTADVILLYHIKNDMPPPQLEDVKIEPFGNDILSALGYKAIRKTLVPGSNHFPVLQFFLKHPEYQYYWCIEDDVVFNGNWTDFFNKISPQLDFDFITSHLRYHADMPKWGWWKAFFFPDGTFERREYLSSFNPIYRISNKALAYIDDRLRNGYSGHHEVLIPTLLKKAGFAIADLGEEDNHITPRLSFCTLKTMRWRPVFLFLGTQKNKLYHPVKQKVTLKQFYIYIKRSITNNKQYRRSWLSPQNYHHQV